ncbi:MAG: response regulator transcription factor [Bacteroidetes bacterium]|nr:response regulator transcription factor [Bacteroidota bacterium]
MDKITLMIVFKQSIILFPMVDLFNRNIDFEVKCVARNGKELKEKYKLYNPDVIISDIFLPSTSGIKAVDELICEGYNPCVVFISTLISDKVKYFCNSNTNIELVYKDISSDELFYKIKKLFRQKKNQKSASSSHNKYNFIECDLVFNIEKLLTKNQIDVFKLYGEGKSISKIANSLFLSEKTIKHYRYEITQELNISSTNELVCLASKYNLLKEMLTAD